MKQRYPLTFDKDGRRQSDMYRRRVVSRAFFIILCVFIMGFLAGKLITSGASNKNINNGKNRGNIRSSELYNNSKNSLNVDDESWKLILVNASNPLPEDFSPDIKVMGNQEFDKRAANQLQAMLDEARELGMYPIICSGYRSIKRQEELFENKVERLKKAGYGQHDAEAEAETEIARPGTSEHNLGLAADIVAISYQLLDKAQEDTAESKWLRKNCQRFGFILRYPEDKQDITGIIYEPWHFRYVGVETATYIMENGLCLEEYLEQSKR